MTDGGRGRGRGFGDHHDDEDEDDDDRQRGTATSDDGGGGGGGGGTTPAAAGGDGAGGLAVAPAPPVASSAVNGTTTTTTNGDDDDVDDAFLDRRYDVVVVGAGLSGAVLAERHASTMNHKVLVLDRRPHMGGNCHDYLDEEAGGIRVCKYGAHLFHTNNERVWEYVNMFGHWTDYEHRVLARIECAELKRVVGGGGDVDSAAVNGDGGNDAAADDGNGVGDGDDCGLHVPVPVNVDTVNALFNTSINTPTEMESWLSNERVEYPHHPPVNSEEVALSRVGRRLYSLLFEPYTRKQWDRSPRDLGPEVLARIPVRTDRDDRYFSDKHQALPTDGYSSIFDRMLDHPNVTVRLSTDYFDVRHMLRCDVRTYYTGPIDRYFASSGLPKLEYRSLTFERRLYRDTSGYHQPAAVVNHPSPSVPYTRAVEYKHFLYQKSPHTVVFYERSCDDGEPYYPVPNARNRELHRRYQELARVEEDENDVVFVGRLANYKYFNMDQAILNALEVFDDYVAVAVASASVKEGGDERRSTMTTIAAPEEQDGVETGGEVEDR